MEHVDDDGKKGIHMLLGLDSIQYSRATLYTGIFILFKPPIPEID